MNLIILLVFGGAFSVVALLMIAAGTGASQQTKKVLATLDSALATSWTNTSDQIVDLRKQERDSLDQSLAAEDRTCAAASTVALPGQPQMDSRRFDSDVRRCCPDPRLLTLPAERRSHIFSIDWRGVGCGATGLCVQ
jgi:hypothetical protein